MLGKKEVWMKSENKVKRGKQGKKGQSVALSLLLTSSCGMRDC